MRFLPDLHSDLNNQEIRTGRQQLIRMHWRIQGGRQGRAPPPGGPNSFIFMQFSAKMWKIIAILGVGAPPPGENPGSATGMVLPKNLLLLVVLNHLMYSLYSLFCCWSMQLKVMISHFFAGLLKSFCFCLNNWPGVSCSNSVCDGNYADHESDGRNGVV